MNKALYILAAFMTAMSFMGTGSMMTSCSNGSSDSIDTCIYDSSAIHIALLPTMDCLPFYYAEAEGLFDSLGINIDLMSFQSAMDCDTAFQKGIAQCSVCDLIKANVWKAAGDSVCVIMSTNADLFLMTSASSRLNSTSSLKEKIIAITRNSQTDMALDRVMTDAKMKPEDINRPQVNDVSLRGSMLAQNQYDGAIMTEPWASDCEARGARRLMDCTHKLDMNMSVLVTRTNITKNKKEDIAKLIKAYNIAVDRLNGRIAKNTILIAALDSASADTTNNSEKFIKATIQKMELLTTYFPKEAGVNIPDTIIKFKAYTKATVPSRKSVSDAATWAIGRNLMKSVPAYADLVDSTFAKQ